MFTSICSHLQFFIAEVLFCLEYRKNIVRPTEFQEFKDLIKQNRAHENQNENNQRSHDGTTSVKKEENESNVDDSDEDNKENVFIEEDKKQHHKVGKIMI